MWIKKSLQEIHLKSVSVTCCTSDQTLNINVYVHLHACSVACACMCNTLDSQQLILWSTITTIDCSFISQFTVSAPTFFDKDFWFLLWSWCPYISKPPLDAVYFLFRTVSWWHFHTGACVLLHNKKEVGGGPSKKLLERDSNMVENPKKRSYLKDKTWSFG